MNRYFLVAGHTDNVKYPPGGPFKDNWGLSLVARAPGPPLPRSASAKPPTRRTRRRPRGGGLNPARWAAAGYGETDPGRGHASTQQSDDERKKNRRVELVVQPNVEEMLNLNNIR